MKVEQWHPIPGSMGTMSVSYTHLDVYKRQMERITLAALYASDVLLTPVCLDKFCRDNLLLVEEKYGAFCEQVRELDWKIFANKVENKKAQRNTYEDMSCLLYTSSSDGQYEYNFVSQFPQNPPWHRQPL